MLAVQPVAIHRALFCILCSSSVLVSEVIGDQIVEPYSSTGLVIAWYVARTVSFCFPHFDVIKHFSMPIELLALSVF